MRRTLLTIALVLLCCAGVAAQKLSTLPSATPSPTDALPYVSDPAGTPATKKTTVSGFLSVLTPSFLPSSAKNGTGTKFQLFTGSFATNDCAKFDANGNVVTNGGSCAAAAPVQSIFGRTGAVVAAANDYNFNQLAGTASKSQQHSATVYNDQANSYSSGFAQSFYAGTNFELKDPTTNTKKIQFDLSNLTAANTRIVTAPDANASFVQPITCVNQFIRSISSQGLPACASVDNASLINSSITIQGSAVALGGSALATNSTAQLLRLGLDQAADASAPLAITGAANNITLFQAKRNTDTSPTGAFTDFQNAAGGSLWKVDITGSLAAGTVPVARVSGLATVATSGAASDLTASLTSYTPTVTCGSGTITTLGTVSGGYQQLGKLIFVSISVAITTNGTCASDVRATLPFTAYATREQALFGIETQAQGVGLRGYIPASGTTVRVTQVTPTNYPGGSGTTLIVNGWYVAQ
jgi:hypothetical protein